jgi:hypothetical protein
VVVVGRGHFIKLSIFVDISALLFHLVNLCVKVKEPNIHVTGIAKEKK